jgi:hypothetical protein
MPHVRSLFISLVFCNRSPVRRAGLALAASLLVCWTVLAEAPARRSVADTKPATADWSELIARPEVAGFFSWMVDQSTGSLEVAAFILRDDDGTVSFLPWPRSGGFRTERWRGALPPNVIAVAHTHPNDPVGVTASAHDRLEAKRIGLPVFIVMRGRISVVDPETGRHTILARGGGWRNVELSAMRHE